MSPSLEKMSLEELWQLFPIFLREHQDEWKEWYEEERLLLLSFLPANQLVRISHIGSTSVETIWAKPIVDASNERLAAAKWLSPHVRKQGADVI